MTDVTEKPTAKRRLSFSTLALLSIAVLMIWRVATPLKSAVNWSTDLKAAMQTAKDQQKPMLINFSTKMCTYCRQMEAEVFPQQQVLRELERFVPVKIDANRNPGIAARYDVQVYPTYVITDPQGNPLLLGEGYQPAEAFIRFLRRAPGVFAEPR